MTERSTNSLRANSIQKKLILVMAAMLASVLCVNLFIFNQINSMVRQIDSIFTSNVTIGELADTLGLVENRVYEYLNTKSSTALEDYYRYEQEYRDLIQQLNNQNVDSDTKMLEKNIRNMSETYLAKTEETLQAKRGRNVERYKACFEEETQLFEYINYYFYEYTGNFQYGHHAFNLRFLSFPGNYDHKNHDRAPDPFVRSSPQSCRW